MVIENVLAMILSIVGIGASLFVGRQFLSKRADTTRYASKTGKSGLVPVFAWLTGIIAVLTFLISTRTRNLQEAQQREALASAIRSDSSRAIGATQRTEAVAAIVAARVEAASDTTAAARRLPRVDPGAITRTVGGVVNEQTLRRLEGTRILWVDDHPDNNGYEQDAFRSLGVGLEMELSTEGALEAVRRQRFDLIVSDASRQGVRDAGLRLIKALRESGNNTPVIIYRAASNDSTRQQAISAGAVTETADPEVLFTTAVPILERPRANP
jgi:CheY-like chemotaxis protein